MKRKWSIKNNQVRKWDEAAVIAHVYIISFIIYKIIPRDKEKKEKSVMIFLIQCFPQLNFSKKPPLSTMFSKNVLNEVINDYMNI